jgi:hypothetical protein
MKKLLLSAVAIAFLAACHDRRTDPQPRTLTGGTGGPYKIAVFTTNQIDSGVEARVFIKYAANKAPGDTTQYDEAKNAEAEPGFGPHVHFNNLKTGTYFIKATHSSTAADTAIVLTDNSPAETELTLRLK